MIIDGANIGYFKQNFAGAPDHIEYKQVRCIAVDMSDHTLY